MRRLKPLSAMVSQSRSGAAHIVSAWHPCWSNRNSATATMRRCATAAKTLASSGCGCIPLRRRAATGRHRDSLPEYLQSSCLIRPRDAATLCVRILCIRARLAWLKKTDVKLHGVRWTHRRVDPRDVRFDGFSAEHSHSSAV